MGSLAAATAQTAPAQPPVQAFAVPEELSAPALSPDGKHLASIEVHAGKRIGVVRTLDPAGVPAVGIPIDQGFLVRAQWVSNERLLLTVNVNMRFWGENVKPWFRTFTVDTKGQNMAVMFSDNEARNYNYGTATVSDLAMDDPDHIYMPIFDNANNATLRNWDGQAFRYSMFRVNVKDGTSERVSVGGPQTGQWIMDGHGKVVGRVDKSLNPPIDHLLVNTNGEWKEIQSASSLGRDGIGVVGLTRDGKGFIETAQFGDAKTTGLVSHNIADGKDATIFSDPKYDIGAALRDPWDQRVLGVTVTADQDADHYFDDDMQALQRGISGAFPGNTVHAVSWDMAKTKVVLQVEGPKFPPTYFLLDRVTHSASPLASSYSTLEENQLGEMKPYPYKARDGLDIPAYITLPPGKTAKNLPVVVMPHGGPMARDQIGFDWMAQFLANRGYAVLQPNFRGSDGYGHKFLKAGYGEWGGKMQDDVTDGVKKLIADGIADPKRICIVGWSYGGYAALSGAAFTPDLYACAVGGAGVYDLKKFLDTRAKDYGKDSDMIASWSLFIGDRSKDADKLAAASPAKNADKIKIPVLLVHGKDDYTVRIDQTEAMDEALRQAGKKVTTIIIPGESHYLQKMETRVQWLTELEKFLKENIGN
ncbi:alpha/beta fold hydrolase [Rhizomicrobium electricum]|uniref:alpha/beta fold hydrolase n=1 Tax=Rhizomicrobium electricum TaxID=480070 RepID=UPI00141F884D|nr:dipeptidyl aminopeptidase/acylaminoacyl peptidase [Rhizomicrobium electricum]